jgi:hypothetical protein
MNEKKCGTCEYHESFTGACFNGRSNNCADFTDDDDVCSVWEKRTTAEDKDVRQNKKRLATTQKIVELREKGKTCKDCAKFERDLEFKAAGWCPIPKKNRVGVPIGDKKYVVPSHNACKFFEDKGEQHECKTDLQKSDT